MLKLVPFILMIFFFLGCSAGKINYTINTIPETKQILIIQKRLENPKIDKYYFSQKQQILEKIKLLHELEKNKELGKANLLKENLLYESELLSLKADTTDMELKKKQYKKDLEIYGNNAVLDELDELLKQKSDENSTGVEQ